MVEQRLGVLGTLGLSALMVVSCGSEVKPTPTSTTTETPRPTERSLDSYVYRVSFKTGSGIIVNCYTDTINNTMSFGDIARDLYCPDENVNKELELGIINSGLTGIDRLRLQYHAQIEIINQELRLSSGSPIPSPFANQ